MHRPSVFIGSSLEGIRLARSIQKQLRRIADIKIWEDGFELGFTTLESLVIALDTADFAVLVLTPDDLILSRGTLALCPRDNVMFELGLFMGRLDRSRAFVVCPNTGVKLPSDLAGITVAFYQEHSGEIADTKRPCKLISDRIRKLGAIRRPRPGPVPLLSHARKQAGTIGIALYKDRESVAQHAIADIRNAQQRVWLLGIALSNCVNLSQSMPVLTSLAIKSGNAEDKRSRERRGVRILLMDPFRSTAIFRTLLESPVAQIKAIFDNMELPQQGPLLNQPLFSKLKSSAESLQIHPSLSGSVRFYGQSPSCWLLIVDDVAYFEPYTFGESPNHPAPDHCIGPNMPVFKVRKRFRGELFEILENHFEKLWATSDTDLLHYRIRDSVRADLVSDVFRHRKTWLRSVCGVLCEQQKSGHPRDQRAYPRQPCTSSIPVTVVWAHEGKGMRATAAVVDFSVDGLRLDLSQVPQGGLGPGAKVKIKIKTSGRSDSDPASILAAHYESLCDGTFLVVRLERPQMTSRKSPHSRHGLRCLRVSLAAQPKILAA
jgi:CAP12/Pycsar effector protein, TIR domain